MDREEKVMKILWAVCLIPLAIGIILLSCAKTKTIYSTSEYWVAKDYHHVYEKYSGQIADYISEDETCEIKGDEIIVTQTKRGLYVAGGVITALFGIFTAVMVFGKIGASDWWQRVRSAVFCED